MKILLNSDIDCSILTKICATFFFFFFFDLGGRVLISDVRSGLKKFGESREERRESYGESSRERKGETACVVSGWNHGERACAISSVRAHGSLTKPMRPC